MRYMSTDGYYEVASTMGGLDWGGGPWSLPHPTVPDRPKYIICKYCHSKNKGDESNCIKCGAPLPLENNDDDDQEETHARFEAHEEDDEPVGLIAKIRARLMKGA